MDGHLAIVYFLGCCSSKTHPKTLPNETCKILTRNIPKILLCHDHVFLIGYISEKMNHFWALSYTFGLPLMPHGYTLKKTYFSRTQSTLKTEENHKNAQLLVPLWIVEIFQILK